MALWGLCSSREDLVGSLPLRKQLCWLFGRLWKVR